MNGRIYFFGLAIVSTLILTGCFPAQIYPTLQQRGISLRPGDLEAHGIGFITPSAATGQEEEKQAVALVFAETMQKERKAIRVVPLAETLGVVNRAGLADAYTRMYSDYRDTGLLKREILQQVGKVTGVRYMAQIKVQSFGQKAKERFGIFGLRIVETKTSGVRLFFQIWDSEDGTVAWEATQELHYSYDTVTERQPTLPTVVGRAAQDLVAKLP
ncbi:MAG: hypothetical protein EHM59_08165 [Betaproteobacteria bacterium]|nr:MAG: hypothetical protein EHM59_08165 [Betaproteobacteria bacterium]